MTTDNTIFTPDALKAYVMKSLDDDKGENVIAIDLDKDLALADTIVIASGTSGRHIAAMAEKLKERLKIKGYNDIAIEGLGDSNWVVLDAGDVIVHLFRPETREHYNIEKMWGMELPPHTAGSSNVHAS